MRRTVNCDNIGHRSAERQTIVIQTPDGEIRCLCNCRACHLYIRLTSPDSIQHLGCHPTPCMQCDEQSTRLISLCSGLSRCDNPILFSPPRRRPGNDSCRSAECHSVGPHSFKPRSLEPYPLSRIPLGRIPLGRIPISRCPLSRVPFSRTSLYISPSTRLALRASLVVAVRCF